MVEFEGKAKAKMEAAKQKAKQEEAAARALKYA